MKKIIMFLMCCLLFISCGSSSKDKIFEKDIITLNEVSDYMAEFEKQNPYHVDGIDFYSSNVKFPEKEMNSAELEEIFLNKDSSKRGKYIEEYFDDIYLSADDTFEEFSEENINKLFNIKDKEFLQPIAIKFDKYKEDLKAKLIKTGLIKLTENYDREIAYLNMKNNKIDKMFFISKERDGNYGIMLFTKMQHIKRDFKQYKFNDNVVVTKAFGYQDTMFKKYAVMYKLLKPIQDGDKVIYYFLVEYDINNNMQEQIKMIYASENSRYGLDTIIL